ncbi:lipase family protein [Pseudomonas izuensis]|uniref:Lipase family protein n=1 Tax=Pseudomonas izuensis TaxID=2684212 RepID=A0ABM7RYV8_9PSED|nr:lipase [Pseudomonas izuensis]BCX69637.1 lipase family protein [Pseudomonas izuensis]
MKSMDEELSSRLSSRVLACPVQGKWTSFQLVDEFGSGEPYAGLVYTVIDSEGQKYSGYLDITGTGKVTNHFAGPVALVFHEKYEGTEQLYKDLRTRPHYPLQITELQVRAEQARFLNPDATRPISNPAQACADEFVQIEVRHLVEHVSHLPPESSCPGSTGRSTIMGEHGKLGFALLPQQHTVLEVRPLRALRPMLSTGPDFCALNLYQLALMSTLSYCPFGQEPEKAPINSTVSFPLQPSVGNWFGDAMAVSDEIWQVNSSQTKPYYPLYEDVPYSKRLEIVPFDPSLYDVNNPALKSNQEHPAKVHFLNDIDREDATDTQAFITHNDELILIAVRGTSENPPDALRDADAYQVPFQGTDSKVHRGFYGGALKAYDFVLNYLDKFYAGQKLLICGHSLGGAVALLLAEMLRRRSENYTLQLYTYGAPRAGDANFVKGAEPLVHYRMVNHNDPVPSVPGTWMNTKANVFGAGAAMTFVNVPLGLSVFVAGITNWTGEPYEHHGALLHFMPVRFNSQEMSSILWQPGCDVINQHAACTVALQQQNGLPQRPSLLSQIFQAADHFMAPAYIPACWATLRRWQQASESNLPLITRRELQFVEGALNIVSEEMRRKRQDLMARPDAYVRSQEKLINALEQEIDRIKTTQARLAPLSYQSIKQEDVYGVLCAQPEQLAQNLARWQAHPQNQAPVQLAVAPQPGANERSIPPMTIDIDSIV